MAISSVCAIVLNYLGAEKTERCLRSLIDQSLDIVYLVDNSASQLELRALESVIEKLKGGADYTVNLLVNQRNLGFAAAVNGALKVDRETTGGHEYYLLINNDAQASPGLVQALFTRMNDDRRLALVSSAIRSTAARTCYRWYQRYMGLNLSRRWPSTFPYLSGCCLLVRRDALREDGTLFDEDFFIYGEDVELCWRMMRERRAYTCIADIAVEHEGTGSSRHGGLFYEYHIVRGHILLARKLWRSRIEIPLLLCVKILFLLVRCMVRSFRHRSLNPAIALLLAWFPLRMDRP